jgi:hypothetical protein
MEPGVPARHAALRRLLDHLDGLNVRQRASVIETLRGAVAPWLAA